MAFLSRMTDEQKRNAIAGMSDERKAALLRRCWRGVDVRGLDLDAAMAKAGAAFTAQRVPMFIDGPNGARVRIPHHVALRNSQTLQPITVATSTFGVLQHSEAVEPMRPVLARQDAMLLGIDLRDDGAKFDAFALLGFDAVARSGIEQADGLAYMLRAGNAHDGTAAMWIALSIWRLRCSNGQGFWQYAGRQAVKHTSRAHVKLADFGSQVHELLGIAERQTAELQTLADSPMSATEFVEFAQEWLIEVRGEVEEGSSKADKRVDDAAELLQLFQGATGTRTNLGRDRYDALNAITEWLTPRQEAYRKSAERFASAFYSNETGARAGQRAKALRLLTR